MKAPNKPTNNVHQPLNSDYMPDEFRELKDYQQSLLEFLQSESQKLHSCTDEERLQIAKNLQRKLTTLEDMVEDMDEKHLNNVADHEGEVEYLRKEIEKQNVETERLEAKLEPLKRIESAYTAYSQTMVKFHLLDVWLNILMDEARKCTQGPFRRVSGRAGNRQLKDNVKCLCEQVPKYLSDGPALNRLIGIRKILTHEWSSQIGSFLHLSDGGIDSVTASEIRNVLADIGEVLEEYTQAFISEYFELDPNGRALEELESNGKFTETQLHEEYIGLMGERPYYED